MAENRGPLRRRRWRLPQDGRTGPARTGPARSARQREIDRQLRVWTPRRVLGWVVAGIAVLVAVVHWIAHLGYPVLPLSLSWQDLLLGYPAAALLGVGAAVILGSGPGRTAGARSRSSRR